ncbi:uncharacterized protein [Eucyclogobius newberryi]|uniref:uncharacterized protein n=1 Tax=Eucyclogobius newberryi TaxID=166745 RepID=UPI003B5AB77C
MDVHMSNNILPFGTPEAVHDPGDDELKFLSPEEQEIIHFFEQTIDSLEQSLEDEQRPQDKPFNNLVDVNSAFKANPKEQDIIDLVRAKPDLVQTKETTFNPTSPGFQSLVPPPECHVYHPPGSVPTPALIAQKIAENQTSGGTVQSASSLLRRRSSEFDKSSSNRQGPPTSTKPARYPANISVILGNKEQPNPSLANINIEERRAQMLANLSGTSHPLLQENLQEDQTERNTPTRSSSFRDPTPDKSRMEALSKLGLSRNRSPSGDVPYLEPLVTRGSTTNVPEPFTNNAISVSPNIMPITTVQEPRTPASRKALEHSSSAAISTNINLPEPDSHKSFETRYSPPSTYSQQDFPAPPPPVETWAEFNPYGGKSIVVNSSVNSSASVKSDLPPSPVSPEPNSLSPVPATPSEFNLYGGKSKVMTPLPSRRDLPDILSSHIEKSQTVQSASSVESNNYGGKTLTINPSGSASRPPESSSRTFKPPAPTPAPRPPRHSYHGPTAAAMSPQRALSPEHKRRSASLFRPQGITVQFSGKGASEESRREALRKLGLLKD